MDTKKIIEEAMPDIKAAIAQQLTTSIMQSITYETTEEIKKTVIRDLVEELSPRVREIVQAHREDLIATLCTRLDEVAKDAGDQIGKALKERMAKQFSTEWESAKVVKAVFGL